MAIFDFFDVNRVEVLRGPQGTLYGRNATGGVIKTLSNEPTDEFGGYVTLDVGDYNKRRVEAAINGAFTENVAARLSVLYAERDGYTDNVYPGRDAVPPSAGNSFGVPAISSASARDADELDNQDLLAVRGQIRIGLGDSASLLLGAELIQDDSLPPAFKYFATGDSGLRPHRAERRQGGLGLVLHESQVGTGLRDADFDHRLSQDRVLLDQRRRYFTQFNRDVVAQDAYDLVNARVTYAGTDERWSITAYGNNLTDEDYFVTVLESGVAAPGTVVPQAVVGAPRTYGVVLNYNF